MSQVREQVGVAQAPDEAPPGIGSRLFALSALVGTTGSLLWLAVAIVRVFTDSWIAPIALGPDNDAVLTMNLELTRQEAEIARVRAEQTRIDAQIEAVDQGIARLRAISDNGTAVMEYGAETSGAEEGAVARTLTDLHEEHAILERLIARQTTETERAREHLAAGLIERRELEQQEQALDSLTLQRVENERATEEAQLRRQRAHTSVAEFHASLDGQAVRMPEIVGRHEADAHLEVEIIRLEAERRGLVAMREVAEHSAASLQAVLDQIQSRPVYLATREPMNVAFVPYEQLEGVEAGRPVFQCDAAIFFCRDVGRVREVLPGEVVMQDPWGELARGRYAVLDLETDDAVQERILRVR